MTSYCTYYKHRRHLHHFYALVKADMLEQLDEAFLKYLPSKDGKLKKFNIYI